jgi:hypothetical protein
LSKQQQQQRRRRHRRHHHQPPNFYFKKFKWKLWKSSANMLHFPKIMLYHWSWAVMHFSCMYMYLLYFLPSATVIDQNFLRLSYITTTFSFTQPSSSVPKQHFAIFSIKFWASPMQGPQSRWKSVSISTIPVIVAMVPFHSPAMCFISRNA